VDEQQVDIVCLQFGETLFDGLPDGLTALTHSVGGHLGGEKNLFPPHPTVDNALPHLGLIFIGLRRIYVAKTCLDGHTHILPRRLTPQSPGASTYLRNFQAVVQFDLVHQNKFSHS